MAYLGAKPTINTLAPLLQGPSANTHATVIALLMNAAQEMERVESHTGSWIRQIARYLSLNPVMLNPAHPTMCIAQSGRLLFRMRTDCSLGMSGVVGENDHADESPGTRNGTIFVGIERESGTKMKALDAVVEKWPSRLKLCYQQPGAQEEFDAAMACPHNPSNNYLERPRVTG